MKAEELRIGAIVQYKWFEKPSFRKTIIHREQVCVLAIDGENKRVLIKPKQHRKNHTWVNLATIQPIPLSEEVLLKCGFVKDGDTDYYTCRKIGFTINLSGSLGYRTCIWSNDHVKHLHQLQNLYYALTGEELEVKWS